MFDKEPRRNGELKTEAEIINEIRLEASKHGAILWRNNTGAAKDISGRIIRYGLANESTRINKEIKSSDLIGVTRSGKFLAIEVKNEEWFYKGTEHEKAQLRFLNLVNERGGVGCFCNYAPIIGELLKNG